MSGIRREQNEYLEELSPQVLNHFVSEKIFRRVKNHKEHLALHPFWLTTPKQGVLEEMRKTLGKWNSKLAAYVVGFENVSCDSETAALNEDHKWLHLDISVTFYLYTPEVGQQLTGVVKKKGNQAAICILFNVFSATVYATNEEELNGWSFGDEVQFEITSFQNRRKGPVIRASSNLTLSTIDDSVLRKSPKKKKKKKSEESWE